MTLIELMVSMLVMTIGIVGLVTLMARASQASSSTEDNLRAAVLASDIVNDMWTSNVPNPPTLATWQARVADATQSGLPNAVGNVAVDGNRVATVTITWTTPSGAARQYTTDVRLN
jgi:type IV pilus assembly protein PilV